MVDRIPKEVVLEKVGPENLLELGIGCITNPRHEGYGPKVRWLGDRFGEGLRFFLFRDEVRKPLAFLEFVPGEHAWRPVEAEGWLFVHCLWVYGRGQKVGGLGSRLIQACIAEADSGGFRGVAALVRNGPWMAGKEVFLRNGFEVAAEREGFELVVHRLRDGPGPGFKDLRQDLARFPGLHVVYSAQCPYLPKSVNDLKEVAADHGIELGVTVLKTPRDAQNAPSYYGVFNLLWDGRLLSDHYVSKARFRNLLKKEILET
jgi:hypothetical protein